MEKNYEELFKPYCFNFKLKDAESKANIEFIFSSKKEAFDLFKSVYDTTYGSIYEDENLISVHTGGWSENELIISEFKKTWWWSTCIRMQSVGGHYYFDTDKSNGVKEWQIIKS